MKYVSELVGGGGGGDTGNNENFVSFPHMQNFPSIGT